MSNASLFPFPHCTCILEGKFHGLGGGRDGGEREGKGGDRPKRTFRLTPQNLKVPILWLKMASLSQDGPITGSVLLSAKMSNCDI